VSGVSTATGVSAGGAVGCTALANGTVRCWGSNGHGQLGDGTQNDSSSPVAVTGISSASQVGTGDTFVCGPLGDGTARCWGRGHLGQLGRGSTADSFVAVKVRGALVNAEEVAAGHSHSCALLAGGTVRCWGHNIFGQIGNGTTANALTPVTVDF
jgi:alpha-tubulin suppressor-like RCC1 family protein